MASGLFGSGPQSNILNTVAGSYENILSAEKQKGASMREAMGAFGKAIDPKTIGMNKFKKQFADADWTNPETYFQASQFLTEYDPAAAMSMSQRGIDLAKTLAKTNAVSIGPVRPEDHTPESLEKYRTTGVYSDLVRVDSPDKMTDHLRRRLSSSTDRAVEARTNVAVFTELAGIYENASFSGGVLGLGVETWKEFAGTQDEVSELKEQYFKIRGSEVIKSLPKGPASDLDIKQALKGFPKDTANPQQVASFFRGMVKIEKAAEKFESFKANYISEHASERGMLTAWEDSSSEVLQVTTDADGNLVFKP